MTLKIACRLFTSGLVLVFLIPITNSYSQTINSQFVDGRVYTKLFNQSNIDLSTALNGPLVSPLLQPYGILSIHQAFQTPGVSLSKIYAIEFSQIALVDNLISTLSSLPYIEYAEKAPLYNVNFIPNDYTAAEQYALAKIEATTAWDIHKGQSKVIVAIVDNGVFLDHEDLTDSRWVNTQEIPNNMIDDDLNGYIDDVNGYDVADLDGDPSPPLNGPIDFVHGTHVAGIAAAKSDNNKGISSIGYQSQIMAVKATPSSSDGKSITKPFEGVDYAIRNGANVVNMSFGGGVSSFTWNLLIQQAELNNVLLIAAAGNDNSESPQYPAAYPLVVSVGATDQNDQRAGFSNYGSTIDVMAPGVSMLSTFIPTTDGYGYLSGTSMSSPLVAGLVSLIQSYDLSFTNEQVRQFLFAGCDNIDSQNSSDAGKLGSGRINAKNSLMRASGQNPPPQAGITAEDALLNLHIYPNPARENITVDLDPTAGYEAIEIIDIDGRVLHHLPINNSATQQYVVSLSNLEAGIYFIKLQGKYAVSKKFVIE